MHTLFVTNGSKLLEVMKNVCSGLNVGALEVNSMLTFEFVEFG